MFNSLVFTRERNFEVTFGTFSVLVSQINVLESYLRSVLKLRALNFKIVAVSQASNRFVSFKYRWKADAEHFLKM